jgi:hypothetical protein
MSLLASRRLTVVLLLGTALAAVVLLAGTRLVRAQAPARVTDATALLTTNRTGLKICVAPAVPDAARSALQAQLQGAQERVRAALAQVAPHPDFQAAGLGREPLAVDVGCPAPPTIANPRFTSGGVLGAPATVATPSPYRAFVFIALPEQLSPTFRDRAPRTTAQELLCQGKDCTAVTAVVYLTPDELGDRAFLERSLTRAVGLIPVGEPRFDPAPLPPARRGPASPTASPGRSPTTKPRR